jgi:phospholipase A1/A2
VHCLAARRKLKQYLAAIPLIATPMIASSAPVAPTVLADCHAITGVMERLACYDRASGRPTDPANPPGDAAAKPKRALATATAPAPSRTSMIDAAWDFDPSTPRYALGLYRPSYVLPARYSDRPNNQPFAPLVAAEGAPPQNLDNVEAKFQLSFKARLWSTDDRRFGLWGAYTQQSQWQVYNDKGIASRPFRETDYQPELFMSYRPAIELPGGFNWKVVNAGFIHQSNGRSEILSRSWNRLFAEAGVERGDFAVFARVWYRIKEDEAKDDNRDIIDFLGHGEIDALYRWRGHSFHLGGRENLRTHKGAVRAGWTTPPLLGPFRGYVQVFSGYGESLIDYNWKQSTIGIGIALNDGL